MTAISHDAEPMTRGELERVRVELRGDIATLRADLATTPGEFDRLRLDLRGDIATLRGEVATLSADIQRGIHAQTRWIIGAGAVITAVSVAILRLT